MERMERNSGERSERGERGERGERKPGGKGKGRFSRTRVRRKKVCRLCSENVTAIDYKDTEILLGFLTEKGKIIPRRISGNCTSHQRLLSRAVKRSRHAALTPFQIL